jgi:hypothetical protein
VRKSDDSKWIARGRMTIPKWQFKADSERKSDNSYVESKRKDNPKVDIERKNDNSICDSE